MENNMPSKIISATIVLVSGVILVGVGAFLTPEQVKEVVVSDFDFAVESIKETATSTSFYYTTIKESTTSEYELMRELATVTIDNVGKNMCLDGLSDTGITTISYDQDNNEIETFVPFTEKEQKEFCEEEQAIQLKLNEKWFLEGELGRVNMLKYK